MAKDILHDFTTGNVTKLLVKFAFPIFLANILQMIYQTVDTIVVGQVMGSVGISAISVGGDIISMLTIMVMGFSGAAQIIMSQHIGAGRKDKLGAFFGTFSLTILLAALVLTVAGLILRKQMLSWMNTPEEAFSEALSYLTVTTCGLIFVYGYNAFSSVVRGLGDSKHPFLFVAISSVCNLILDLILVVGFRMGSFGAAVATVISQGLSFLIIIWFLIKSRNSLGFTITRTDWKIRGEYLLPLLKLGIPMALKNAAIHISKLFTNSYINSYGVIVSAVTGIGNKICTIAALVSNALSAAGGSVVGQNIGAEKYDRVLRTVASTLVLSLASSAVVAVALLLFPTQFFTLFTKDKEILPVAMEYVPILVVMFASSATRSAANAFINGTGNHVINLIVALLDALILRVGLGLLFGLALGMKYRGFWLGSALSSFMPMIIGGIYLLSGKWKTRKYIIRN